MRASLKTERDSRREPQIILRCVPEVCIQIVGLNQPDADERHRVNINASSKCRGERGGTAPRCAETRRAEQRMNERRHKWRGQVQLRSEEECIHAGLYAAGRSVDAAKISSDSENLEHIFRQRSIPTIEIRAARRSVEVDVGITAEDFRALCMDSQR